MPSDVRVFDSVVFSREILPLIATSNAASYVQNSNHKEADPQRLEFVFIGVSDCTDEATPENKYNIPCAVVVP